MAEIWNLSAICRCCHIDGSFKSLSECYESEVKTESFANILSNTFGVNILVTSQETSYTICEACIQSLLQASQFKFKVLQCELKFSEYCRNEQLTTMKVEHSSYNGVNAWTAMESDAEREAPVYSPPSNFLRPEKDFILTYEALPELWDNMNPNYTNKCKRNEKLAKLLPILRKTKPDASIEDVKKKINSYRSNYRREIKKMVASQRSGAAPDNMYTPKIWYFPYLHFLNKLESIQESELTNQLQTEPEIEIKEQNSQQAREIQERTFPSISTFPKLLVSPTKKKKKINQDELHATHYSKEPVEISNYNEINKSQIANLSYPIALEWSYVLDRLDPVQRIYAKKAINDILFEAELGNLKRDSVRITLEPTLSLPNQNNTQSCKSYSM